MDFESLEVNIPPLAEQRRIVAEIDRQFSRLDAAVAALERARAKLRRHRTAVLNAYCTGIPAGVDGSHIESNSPSTCLRSGWEILSLADLVSAPLMNGRSVPDAVGGFPVLRLTALRGGRIVLNQRKAGDWSSHEAAPYLVQRGDFFVARGSGSLSLVGRGGLVEDIPDPVAFPDTLIRVRVDERRILPKFLRLAWSTTRVRQQVEANARTTAGIYKINQAMMLSFVLAIPNLREQEQIVSEVERRLSVADRVEATVDASLRRTERLRQAILKRAFEGKLVPQDPSDEPASALLARIQAERAAGVVGRSARQTGRAGSAPRRRRTPTDQPPDDIPTFSIGADDGAPIEGQSSFVQETRS